MRHDDERGDGFSVVVTVEYRKALRITDLGIQVAENICVWRVECRDDGEETEAEFLDPYAANQQANNLLLIHLSKRRQQVNEFLKGTA
jgi:hypothetical protein